MPKRGLRFKINAAIFATCAVVTLLSSILLSSYEMNRRKARIGEIQVLMSTVLQQKRNELANEIFAEQRLALARTLQEILKVKGIVIVNAYDLNGRLLLSTEESFDDFLPESLRGELAEGEVFERAEINEKLLAEYTTLIQVIGERVGYVRMYYDLAEMRRETIFTIVFFSTLLLAIWLIMTLFLNLLLSNLVIRPASILRDAIRNVSRGRLGEEVELTNRDEIGDMADDFNKMSARLKDQHIALTNAIQTKEAYAVRLEKTNRELEDLNNRLEDIVDARTSELIRSNEQLLEEIKEREQAEKEKRDLEEKLARSQKMEALGLLAGGVAHDLNNVLSGIVSYPDLLLIDLDEESPLRKPILTIQESGQKAAAIVEDLLTLARRGVTNMAVVNMNGIVMDYLNSPECKRLAGYHAGVRIDMDLKEDVFNIVGSPVHLRKTVMNLVSNAAEAQPLGGRVLIYTENRYLDKPVRGYDDVEAGEYVVLGVKDYGIGIESEDLKRIFEPFYTKKVMGRSGTGLGMAVVWGTVQDHNGYIDVISNKGKGTVFELYFPITRRFIEEIQRSVPVEKYMGNGEKIIVVDDVPEQRDIAMHMLRRLNYKVDTVSSGEEAVEYLKENSADLIILDMIMDPGMDGLETYEELIRVRPGQKVVIASGFAENERVREAQRLGAGLYIKKPYTLESIGEAVKRTLND